MNPTKNLNKPTKPIYFEYQFINQKEYEARIVDLEAALARTEEDAAVKLQQLQEASNAAARQHRDHVADLKVQFEQRLEETRGAAEAQVRENREK